MCENSENLPATKRPKHEDNARTPEFSAQQADASIEVRSIIGLQNDAIVGSDLSIDIPAGG
jgi:hypothetical protein